MEFKIRFHSGIGDCLRLISWHNAINDLAQDSNFVVYWTYDRYPESLMIDTLKVLFKDVKFLKFITVYEYDTLHVQELNNWHNYPGTIRLKKVFNPGHVNTGIRLVDIHRLGDLPTNAFNICVQLSGGDSVKVYPDEKYTTLFKHILGHIPDSIIHLIDKPSYNVNPDLLFDDRIINHVGAIDILETVELIQAVDYHICPDSYSKYVRKWVDKPQTILCGKLDYIEDNAVLRNCFGDYLSHDYPGLLFNKDVTLLGANYNSNLSECALIDHISSIHPMDIFASIRYNR